MNRESVNNIIKEYLPEEIGLQETIFSAMNYSMLAGGKRIRPILMYESYRLFGGNEKIIEPFMVAIEMIHTYSLVHDDLPEMDNDMFRRNKPTTWYQYGHATGTLAGDALLNYAFEIMLKSYDLSEHKHRVIEAMKVMATKAGVYGMIGGQVVDVINSGKSIDMATINFIYNLKTCALLEASMMVGAILAGANDTEVKNIEAIAYKVGLAFQIQDDILDIIGDEEVIGKPVASDEKNDKTTYVSLVGMDSAKEKVEQLSNLAISELQDLAKDKMPDAYNTLKKLIEDLINRDK